MSTRRAFLASLVSLAVAGTLPGTRGLQATQKTPARLRHVIHKKTFTEEIVSPDGKLLALVRHIEFRAIYG